LSVLVLLIVGGAAGSLMVRPGLARGAEAIVCKLYAGFSLCAVVVLAVGSVSLAAVQILMFMLAGLAIGFEAWVWWRRNETSKSSASSREKFSAFEWCCLAAVVASNAIALVSALAPNTSWDAGVAHLALPWDYVDAGRITFLEGNVYSGYPHLLHALYTYSYLQGGELAVGLTNWIFGPLACLAVFALGRRIENRTCGLIAAALFATSPIYFDQVGTVSLDVAFAGMAMATVLCVLAWSDEQELRWLWVAGLLGGMSFGVRHTGLLVCALCVAGVLAKGRKDGIKPALILCTVAVLAASPWVIRSALVVGNPVYPFLLGVFESKGLPVTQTTALGAHESIQGTGLAELLLFPWKIVMRPQDFDGWTKSPGGMVLLLGLPGLIFGGPKIRMLGLFSIVGGFCFFYFQRMARYILPFFSSMMVVAGSGATRIPRMGQAVRVLLTLSFVYGLVLGIGATHFKVGAAFGLKERRTYLAERVERYVAFEWANENLPSDARVLTLDPRSYFLRRPTYQNFEVLGLMQTLTPKEQLDWLESRGIDYLFYPSTYIEASRTFKEQGWNAVLDAWRLDRVHFKLERLLMVPVPRGGGEQERVEIYAIDYEGDSSRGREGRRDAGP